METRKSTPSQNAMIGYQISRLALDTDTKEDLIYTHTDGRSTRIRDLYFHEADAVIKMLTSGTHEAQSPAAKMRRKIISMAHELSWKLPSGKISMDSINSWCRTYGYLKKPLDEYTERELPALVTQFETAYVTYLKKV